MRKALKLTDGHNVNVFSPIPGTTYFEWPDQISLKINRSVLSYAQALREIMIEGIYDIVPAYNSLAVYYDSSRLNESMLLNLFLHFQDNDNVPSETPIRTLPVCYDQEFGIDLQEICQALSIEKENLITIHTASVYSIYFIGFLPGFMYLGGLDERIHVPRKSFPRPSIPAGSVGIGGVQTGIYPIQSPGGWNILGRCPLKLFDPTSTKPCKFMAGDRIQFSSIDRTEFYRIRKNEYP